jgi:hypothetical protein
MRPTIRTELPHGRQDDGSNLPTLSGMGGDGGSLLLQSYRSYRPNRLMTWRSSSGTNVRSYSAV